MRVLIVEDEAMVLLLLEDMLEGLGHDLHGTATSLTEAQILLETSSPPDAVVLDVNLDGEVSYPFADELARRNIPFVFSTGYGHQEAMARYGHCPVLQKPFHARDLAEAIERACGSRPFCDRGPSVGAEHPDA